MSFLGTRDIFKGDVDVVVTSPGLFGGKHGLFLNSDAGTADRFEASTLDVQGVLGATAGVLSLNNPNLSFQDVDGDGVADFLHMPKLKTYSVYSPKLLGQQ